MTHRPSPPAGAPPAGSPPASSSPRKSAPRHLLDEADIGSGEVTPGQQETEEIVASTGAATNPAATIPDPQADEVGTADHLTEQDEDQDWQGQQDAARDGFLEQHPGHEQRRAIEQDEADGLLNELDPVPPKGN